MTGQGDVAGWLVETAAPPAPRTETQTWTAVDGPVLCIRCGHNHWGWVSDRQRLLAPQWAWCDDAACSCRALLRDLAVEGTWRRCGREPTECQPVR